MLSLIFLFLVTHSESFSDPVCICWGGTCGGLSTQIGHDALHLFPGHCMFGTAVMLVVAGLLAIADTFCTKGRGWEIAIFLAGAVSDFGRSDSIILCFACAGLLSLLGGIGQDLVTNRFAQAGNVEGNGVVALVGLDIMSKVVALVVGIRVADTLGSIRGVSTILTLYCLLFLW